MTAMEGIRQLADLLNHSSRTVAFTGAGISTESGIPDFRSAGGLWTRNPPVPYDEFLRSRDARVRFWKQRKEIYRDFAAARPNAGHRALADLERRGKILAVITQNIDGLHQDAGSRRVIEIHGTARIIACVRCRKEWHPDEVMAWIDAGSEAPDCDECAAPLKSRTISFGQPMPAAEMREAAELSRGAELYLAIGSSLVVEPAASLPRLARDHGATLVILNNEPTPLDDRADLILRGTIGPVLQSVLDSMGE
jgi:NAD-dependent deacetylase